MTQGSLLSLPLELRLEIYRELVASVHVSRQVTDLRGLYLACRQTHLDLEHKHVSKIRPLLVIVYGWRSKREKAGVVDLQFASSSSYEEASRITSISLAIEVFPPALSRTTRTPRERLPSKQTLRMRPFLRSVCSQSSPTLTLSIIDTSGRLNPAGVYFSSWLYFRRID